MERIRKYEDLNTSIKKKYIYQDFGGLAPITDEVRNENASRIFTGGVRINKGMYRSDKETEEYIEKSLARKLP